MPLSRGLVDVVADPYLRKVVFLDPDRRVWLSHVRFTPDGVRPRGSTAAGRTRSIVTLALFTGIGVVSAAVTFVAALGAAQGWWPTTPRVAWAPPVLLVAVIRSILYVAAAVAAWTVWTRREAYPVGPALALFVAQQVLATVWPIMFFAGYAGLGLADLWLTVAMLIVLDLLLAATSVAFWGVSRLAGAVLTLDLILVLFVTTLITGSAGQHAYL